MIRDDFEFEPYMDDGWICRVKLTWGSFTIRYGGQGLFANKDTYEVRDVDGNIWGYRTGEDIWHYMKTGKWESKDVFVVTKDKTYERDQDSDK